MTRWRWAITSSTTAWNGWNAGPQDREIPLAVGQHDLVCALRPEDGRRRPGGHHRTHDAGDSELGEERELHRPLLDRSGQSRSRDDRETCDAFPLRPISSSSPCTPGSSATRRPATSSREAAHTRMSPTGSPARSPASTRRSSATRTRSSARRRSARPSPSSRRTGGLAGGHRIHSRARRSRQVACREPHRQNSARHRANCRRPGDRRHRQARITRRPKPG